MGASGASTCTVLANVPVSLPAIIYYCVVCFDLFPLKDPGNNAGSGDQMLNKMILCMDGFQSYSPIAIQVTDTLLEHLPVSLLAIFCSLF